MSRPNTIDKKALWRMLATRIEADTAAITEAQQRTQAGATHEESRAEHAKDTRATESSYLARGLAERLARLHEASEKIAATRPCDFDEDDPIALSALVELEGPDSAVCYLVAPAGGGVRLEVEGGEVLVVTLQSPIGRALIGRHVDDDVRVHTPRGVTELVVLAVAWGGPGRGCPAGSSTAWRRARRPRQASPREASPRGWPPRPLDGAARARDRVVSTHAGTQGGSRYRGDRRGARGEVTAGHQPHGAGLPTLPQPGSSRAGASLRLIAR